MDLSLCIPTRLRAPLLERTLASILEADLRPDEVLIGDNGGPDAATAAAVARFGDRLPIRHVVHDPPLGYGGNLRFLVEQARGDWLGLIHDDDWFLPGVGDLLRAARAGGNIDAWFSDHLIGTHEGVVDPAASARNSAAYGRTGLAAGPVADPLGAVLRNQVCMDGWFARREALTAVVLDERFLDFADVQLLAGLAADGRRWHYEPRPTFAYRASQAGLTTAGLKLHVLYGFLEGLALDPAHAALRDERLRRYAPGAVAAWLRSGDREAARRCLLGPHYPRPRSARAAAKLLVQLASAWWPLARRSA